MTKICMTSDLHGYLPDIPECDILLLCGDYSPNPQYELFWLRTKFRPWISELSKRMTIIGCAGNHDIAFERSRELLPELDWIYLEDNYTEVHGLKIFGMPHSLPFGFGWAFNTEEEKIGRICNIIPPDTDIIISHGPSYNVGDYSYYGKVNCGSKKLAETIQRIRPRIFACGHIHESYGKEVIDGVSYYNVSHVNGSYLPVNPVVEIEL